MSNGCRALRMSVQFDPSTVPKYTSAIVQGMAPNVEYNVKRPSGMRETPAMKLITLRTPGSRRLKKAVG